MVGIPKIKKSKFALKGIEGMGIPPKKISYFPNIRSKFALKGMEGMGIPEKSSNFDCGNSP